MADPPEDITLILPTYRPPVPFYIWPEWITGNRRKFIMNITYDHHDSAENGYIPMAIREELRNRGDAHPPLEVLMVQMYKSFWNGEIQDAIENWRPASFTMTDVRLIDQSKACSEESVLTFHDKTLASIPFMTSVSFAMTDILLRTGGVNTELIKSIEEKDYLRVIVVVPPETMQDVQILNDRRGEYIDALILLIDTFKELRKVFLPAENTQLLNSPLFLPEDLEELEEISKSGPRNKRDRRVKLLYRRLE